MHPFSTYTRALVLAGFVTALPADYVLGQTPAGGVALDELRGALCSSEVLCGEPLGVDPSVPADGTPAQTPADRAPLPDIEALAQAPAQASQDADGATRVTPIAPRAANNRLTVAPRDTDYAAAITLRGSYVVQGDETRTQLRAIPTLAARYGTSRTRVEVGAQAELVRAVPGEARLAAGSADASAEHALDALTTLDLEAEVAVGRDAPRDYDQAPSAVMRAPLAFAGAARAGVTRETNRASLRLSGALERESESGARLEDGTAYEDPDADVTRVSGGLRLGHQITPRLDAFVDGAVTRALYDSGSQDNWAYSASAGLEARWGARLSAEAELGYRWRDFDAPSNLDRRSLLYGASIAYLPRARLSLEARFASQGVSDADAQIDSAVRENTVSAAALYQASTALGLNADLAYLWELDGEGETVAQDYRAGVGADLSLWPNVAVSTGYAYRFGAEESEPGEAEHRVTLDVTIER